MAEVTGRRRAVILQPKLARTYHNEGAKLVYVREVNAIVVLKNYKASDTLAIRQDKYYVSCTEDGTVDWNTAKVFDAHELVGRFDIRRLHVNKVIG